MQGLTSNDKSSTESYIIGNYVRFGQVDYKTGKYLEIYGKIKDNSSFYNRLLVEIVGGDKCDNIVVGETFTLHIGNITRGYYHGFSELSLPVNIRRKLKIERLINL